MGATTVAAERDHLLDSLGHARTYLGMPAAGLTDAQARHRSTASELCIGGLIKHVTRVEKRWADFSSGDPNAFGTFDEAAYAAHAASFVMTADETLAGLLAAYAEAAARTDDLVRTLPDLDVDYPLPVTPWWPEGSRWSARRAIMHIIAETAQHAGHADIIREAIDGQKSMG